MPVQVRLTKKLASALNGIDLRAVDVGEVVELTEPLGRMLIAERWAEAVVPGGTPATADDRPRRQQGIKTAARGDR